MLPTTAPLCAALSLFAAATACRRTVDDNGGLPFVVPYLARQANSVATQSMGVGSNRAVFIWIGTNGEPRLQAWQQKLSMVQ